MISVLIADDIPGIREALRILLESFGDITIVGEAASGPEAVTYARMLRPDVVLMDARMPGGDGIAATRELAGPGVEDPLNVLVMTTFDEDEYIFGALENRAAGFILKNASADELHRAVRDVARGAGVLSPAVVRRVLDEFSQRVAAARPEDETLAPVTEPLPLTERETEVARGVLRGLTNSEIGAELHLAASTVKWHLERIRAKTGARTRVDIAEWARANGLSGR